MVMVFFVLGKAWDIAVVQTGKGSWPDGIWGKAVRERIIQGIWNRLYPSPLLEAQEKPWRAEEDPAYRTARAVEVFFQEHPYLELYGNEETGETFADGNEGLGGGAAGGNGGTSGIFAGGNGEAGKVLVWGDGEAGKELARGNEEEKGNAEENGGIGEGNSSGYAGDAGEQAGNASGTRDTMAASGRAYPGQIFSFAQLQDYDFLMSHFYSVHTSTTAERDLMDARKLLSYDFRLDEEETEPQILIYHTHSQETFAGAQAGETIVAVGGYLAQLLTERGFSVLHDTSEYDVREGKLDRNKAYSYALEGITGILKEHPSIQVVIDLHRDGVGKNMRLVTEVNGKPTAQIMFFNGLSQTPDGPIPYLENPHREENLAFSLQLQLKAAAWYPGLTRKIYLKGLRYNQHLRARSCLIEAGAQTNTYQEVCNAMEPLADILAMVLQGK